MLKQLKSSLRRRKFVGQGGDTIVEVMIVLAVLGLALGVSYATANRSLLNTRQAQENSQAAELVQAQIEALRSLSCSTGDPSCKPDTTLFTATPYCIDTGTNPYKAVSPSSAACTKNGLYNLSVAYANNATNPDTFTVTAQWPDVLGQGTDTVTTVYRIHSTVTTPYITCPGPGETPPLCIPPKIGAVDVLVKAIPPAAGNNTPSCAAAATQSKAANVILTDNSAGGTVVGNKNTTNVNPTASFTGLTQGDVFSASVSRAGFGVCPSGSSTTATTSTPPPVIYKTIYPQCYTQATPQYNWIWGARRADLDGYYGTIPPVSNAFPTAYSYIYTGNVHTGGMFVYAWAGINNSTDAYMAGQGYLYYYLWEVSWGVVGYTYNNVCPS